MRKHFAISPWEHPGADYSPAPQAETQLEVGWKKRRFWLKMRDGVIFFREPSLVPLYAVPKRFDFEASDQEQLIASWKREVEGGNYGSFFTRNALDAPLLAAGRKERSGVATGGSVGSTIECGSSTRRA